MIICYANRPDGYNGNTTQVKLVLNNGKLYEYHKHGHHMSPVLHQYTFNNTEEALWYVNKKSNFYTGVTTA